MPLTRKKKEIENEERSIYQRKAAADARNKNAALFNVNRPVFGLVNNNLAKNSQTAVPKRADQPLKLKNVKPKVDSHWKKTTIVTGTNPTPQLVVAKTSTLAKPEIPKLVVHKPETSSKLPIKRQESIIDRTIRARARKLHTKSSASSSASSVVSSSDNTEDNRKVATPTKLLGSLLAENIENIDANDSDNILFQPEYAQMIYTYLQGLEKEFKIRKDYLADQGVITPKMRSILCDWINEVHSQFTLFTDTYYLSIRILDRFLQDDRTVTRENLQLVGIACLLIASKFEENYAPRVNEFVYITDETYTIHEMIEMEKVILKKLNFSLCAPFPVQFARRFAKAVMPAKFDHFMPRYFMELSTIEYNLVHYLPSAIAAAAVFMTMKILAHKGQSDKDIWSPKMVYYTKYTLDCLRPVIHALARVVLAAPVSRERSVYLKYSNILFDSVALRVDIYGPVMRNLCIF